MKKKALAMMLVVILALALATSAFAAGTNTITVKKAQIGETYKAYKMFDLEVSSDFKAYTYTVATEWAAFFGEGGAGKSFITVTDGNVTAVSDAAGLAAAAAKAVTGKTAAASVQAVQDTEVTTEVVGKAVLTGLDSGYYLITSSNGTKTMIRTTPAERAVEVNEKNTIPGEDKEVQEDSTQAWGKKNDAQIGDTVYYRTTIDVKKNAYNYKMHDVMDTRLTLNAESITVVGLTENEDYTVVTTGITDGCTFEIFFDQDYLDSVTADTTLTVTYNAVLNKTAEVGTAMVNKTKLDWGNQSHTEWVPVETWTYQFEVRKYDASDLSKTNLAGAVFQLQKNGVVQNLIKINDTTYRLAEGTEEGAVTTFTTVSTGNIVIKGVDDDDDYTLVETQQPAGYNKLKEPVEIEIDTENLLVVDVPNSHGSELPETGGVGTTIFYVLGGILVLGAAVLLITKKRMGEAN